MSGREKSHHSLAISFPLAAGVSGSLSSEHGKRLRNQVKLESVVLLAFLSSVMSSQGFSLIVSCGHVSSWHNKCVSANKIIFVLPFAQGSTGVLSWQAVSLFCVNQEWVHSGGSGCYTAVHTVLTVNSLSLAMMSVGWMLRSYMGFSNVARPLVFSWPT